MEWVEWMKEDKGLLAALRRKIWLRKARRIRKKKRYDPFAHKLQWAPHESNSALLERYLNKN